METKDAVYHGTYPIRKGAKNELTIHMPSTVSGDFSIYELNDGNLFLKKAGEKSKTG